MSVISGKPEATQRHWRSHLYRHHTSIYTLWLLLAFFFLSSLQQQLRTCDKDKAGWKQSIGLVFVWLAQFWECRTWGNWQPWTTDNSWAVTLGIDFKVDIDVILGVYVLLWCFTLNWHWMCYTWNHWQHTATGVACGVALLQSNTRHKVVLEEWWGNMTCSILLLQYMS